MDDTPEDSADGYDEGEETDSDVDTVADLPAVGPAETTVGDLVPGETALDGVEAPGPVVMTSDDSTASPAGADGPDGLLAPESVDGVAPVVEPVASPPVQALPVAPIPTAIPTVPAPAPAPTPPPAPAPLPVPALAPAPAPAPPPAPELFALGPPNTWTPLKDVPLFMGKTSFSVPAACGTFMFFQCGVAFTGMQSPQCHLVYLIASVWSSTTLSCLLPCGHAARQGVPSGESSRPTYGNVHSSHPPLRPVHST